MNNASMISPDMALTLMQASEGAKAPVAKKDIDATAKDFEAVFITEMMKPMFEGIETDGPFGGGQAEKIFRDMMLQEVGKFAAQTGGVGISSQVKAELIRAQSEKTDAQQDTAQKKIAPAPAPEQDNIMDLEILNEG